MAEQTRLSGEQFAKEVLRRRSAGLRLGGNTYPKKNQIKELGGIWDSGEKCWLIPNAEVAEALGAQKIDGGYTLVKPERRKP